MFEWVLEDMALRTSPKKVHHNESGRKFMTYPFEETVSREDKIEFVDRMNDGLLSYALALKEKYNADVNILSKTKWGLVNANSFKAWAKKNDTRNILRGETSYRIIDYTDSIKAEKTSYYCCWEDLVDELFHRQLEKCEAEEISYFKSIDEYEILKNKLKEKHDKYSVSFGANLHYSINGDIYVGHLEDKNRRLITIDEIKTLLAAYDRLDALAEELATEIHIE